MSDSLRTHVLYSPWNYPGQNTRVGSRSFLQGIFPTRDRTQVSTLKVDSLPAEPQGSPRILECVAQPFSSGSSGKKCDWQYCLTLATCIVVKVGNVYAFCHLELKRNSLISASGNVVFPAKTDFFFFRKFSNFPFPKYISYHFMSS